jgi:hypothetical protein
MLDSLGIFKKINKMDKKFKNKCKELHKLAVARFDILEAQNACQTMIDKVHNMGDDFYYPLFVTVVICYARPFTQNNIYGRLGSKWEQFPHQIFTDMHKQLLEARNKFVAHSDANARETSIIPQGYTYPGSGRLVSKPTCAVGRFAIPIENFPIAKRNCQNLISGLNYRIEELLNEIVPVLDFKGGPVQLHPLYSS